MTTKILLALVIALNKSSKTDFTKKFVEQSKNILEYTNYAN
jgi:hypothetical protein